MKKVIIVFIFLAFCLLTMLIPLISRGQVAGIVVEEDEKGNFSPLFGAQVRWQHKAVGAITDSSGYFMLQPDTGKIIVSYLGFVPDTVAALQGKKLQIILKGRMLLKEAQIESDRGSTYISGLNLMNMKQMTTKELYKAACCNLSESFETNPSVDVSFSDAITGTKQIRLLGLSSIYTSITTENLPGIRNVQTPFGLSAIPGPWIESIQVTKGAGPVAAGYESIAGHINVEFFKPESALPLQLNGYVNSMGRMEANLVARQSLDSLGKVQNAFFLHTNGLFNKVDMNKDGYIDVPLGSQIGFSDRIKWQVNNNLMAQVGFRYYQDARYGGDINLPFQFKESDIKDRFAYKSSHNDAELFGKLGYIFKEKKYKSIGFLGSFKNHNGNLVAGNNRLATNAKGTFLQVIYQSIIGDTRLKFRTGSNFTSDQVGENLNAKLPYLDAQPIVNLQRNENVVGAFYELTYTPNEKISAIAGIRADYSNLFQTFITPRLHLKYDPVDGTTIRASVGKGYRTVSPFSDQQNWLFNKRQVLFQEGSQLLDWANFRFQQEKAWNAGISINQEIEGVGQKTTLTTDYYFTSFSHKLVADPLQAQNLLILHLQKGSGISETHNVQIELNYAPKRRWETRWAVRWVQSKAQYGIQNLQANQILLPEFRAFANLGHTTRNKKWNFDQTISFTGRQKLFLAESAKFSPAFFQWNGQVSYKPSTKFETYIGYENLLDYRQQQLVYGVAASSYFDASQTWGPVIGRMVYLGFRLNLGKAA